MRGGRAAAQPFEDLLDPCLLALDMGVDPPVRAVAHPSRNAELSGLLAQPGAEQDALHASRNADMTSDLIGHRATLLPSRQGRAKLMPYLEAFEAFDRRILGFQTIYLGARRPVAHSFEQLLDRSLLALDMRLDRAIRGVAHPASDSEAPRLILCPDAKEDALHVAGNANPARDMR